MVQMFVLFYVHLLSVQRIPLSLCHFSNTLVPHIRWGLVSSHPWILKTVDNTEHYMNIHYMKRERARAREGKNKKHELPELALEGAGDNATYSSQVRYLQYGYCSLLWPGLVPCVKICVCAPLPR